MRIMKIIAYLRISTDKQDEASQRQIIADSLKNEPIALFEWLADTASGGTPWQSRSIAGALASLSAGDTLIVSEISRIARSTVGVLTFLQAAAEKSVTVVAVKSGIRLDGSTASKIVVTVLAMAAEIERDLLRERTKGALDARKARGLPVGRQTGALGKRNKLSGRMAEIEPLIRAGVARSAIARVLGVSRQTLHTYLAATTATDAASEIYSHNHREQPYPTNGDNNHD
jgi:DNA invertase Pin-like site-specific DNA recombinase